MNKDSIQSERIPHEISLSRIKKRALSYARQDEPRKKHFKKAAIVPLTIAIFILCFGAYAITHDLWGLFFNNTELLNQNSAVSMFGESRYSEDYKVTLEEAAFGESVGIIILSMEKLDGGKLHPNMSLRTRFPNCTASMMGTQDSRLSEDGTKLIFCQTINYKNISVPDTLELNITAIESSPISTPMAEFPISSIYSESYGSILSKNDSAKLDELYEIAPDFEIEGVQILDIFAAGYVDNQLVVVYKTDTALKKELNRNEYLLRLYDARNDTNIIENAILNLPDRNDPEYCIYTFSGIHEQDLDDLYPVVATFSFEEPVETDLSFHFKTNSRLEEVICDEGIYSIEEIIGFKVDGIKISSLGLTLISTEEPVDDPLDVYCKMLDDTKIEFSSRTLSKDNVSYYMNYPVEDMLLDAEQVKSIYINDQLLWKQE